MMLLPKKAGPFTLMRRLGTDGVTESYVAILDEPAGKQVAARRVLEYVLGDPQRRTSLEARVRDLEALRHAALVPVLDYLSVGEERYIVDEWVDAIDLHLAIQWCRDQKRPPPHNVYLNLATQVCNGLEALHSRPGAETGAAHVLHLGLRPGAIFLTREGRIIVGNYGLARSPTATPHSAGASVAKMEYLSPEQTHQDQTLTPASDIFSLGTILYEMLTLKSMFKAESNLQTIHRVRRAEVTTQLLEVKEILPGLDKVLYRALSLNPRHRYQRAFVLREDLRGLMAGFSFSNIDQDTREFLQPLFASRGELRTDEIMPLMSGDDTQPETTASLLGSEAPRAEDGLTTTSFEVLSPPASVPPAGLPVAFGTSEGPASNDTASFLRAARDSAGAGETRPENPISQPPESEMGKPAPPPAPPRPDFFNDDDVPTDVRPAPDETSWVAKLQPVPPDPQDPPAVPPSEPPAVPAVAPADVQSPAPLAAPVSLPEADLHPPQNLTATPSPSLVSQGDTAVDDFDDLDWRPRKSRMVPVVLAGVGALSVVLFASLCFGGSASWWLKGREPVAQTEDATTVAAAAPSSRDEASPAIAAASADDAEAAARAPAPRLGSSGPKNRGEAKTAGASSRTRGPASLPPTTADARPPAATAPVLAADYADTEEVEVPIVAEAPGDVSGYAERSYQGELTDADREILSDVSPADPDYTRSVTLLYQDARARGDLAGRRTHLSAIMALPENEYRPEFLVEEAELAIRDGQFGAALEKATLAERHWQRLPSELIFTRKAMIFEIAASAYTGLYYTSDGQQMDALDNAIRGWEKYRRHVDAKSRDDLTARADRQLDKLYDMQRRME
jgi:eukaryotic-like serine/threonine-protein kinase